MHFVDECQLRVEAGKGGDGCVAFHREKYLPLGGPAGGDGGRGGSVVFVGDAGLTTLSDLNHQRVYRARSGEPGAGRDCYGRSANDLEVRVPLGTMVFREDTSQKLGELTEHASRLVVAKGGAGGRGNKHFATPIDRAPKRAEDGHPAEAFDIRLELRSMADVGLLGMPNVGKSTFITTVSKARSKVAAYPFTTLHPHLGVVRIGDWSRGLGKSFVIADIPGLVPGSADGQGLGARFLRHVQRTKVLVHLITLTPGNDEEPLENYALIRRELERFDPELAKRTELVVLSKADLPEVAERYPALREEFRAKYDKDVLLLSSATHAGVKELLQTLARVLDTVEPHPPGEPEPK